MTTTNYCLRSMPSAQAHDEFVYNACAADCNS